MSQRIDNRTKRREPTERIATFTAFGLAAEAKPLTPGLYVVATPSAICRTCPSVR
jgi:16S rRNA (cytidine1402-2'-O)-methyltransferase